MTAEFLHILKHSIEDTLYLVPLLFIIYLIIEILEHRYNHFIAEKSTKLGVIGGAIFGLIPQCGFSVMASVLYSKRKILLPTLFAVFIATSDEAIPIILAARDYKTLLYILASKFIIAVVCGYLIYLFIILKDKRDKSAILENDEISEENDVGGCCGHMLHTSEGENHHKKAENVSAAQKIWLYVEHPLRHTLFVTLFIFIVTFLLNGMFEFTDPKIIETFLTKNSYLEPLFTSIFGLIPNCAASVAITKLYLSGVLSFGGTVAGLVAGAGVGLVVLFQKNRPISDSVKIIFLLFFISVISGILINFGISVLQSFSL